MCPACGRLRAPHSLAQQPHYRQSSSPAFAQGHGWPGSLRSVPGCGRQVPSCPRLLPAPCPPAFPVRPLGIAATSGAPQHLFLLPAAPRASRMGRQSPLSRCPKAQSHAGRPPRLLVLPLPELWAEPASPPLPSPPRMQKQRRQSVTAPSCWELWAPREWQLLPVPPTP